MNFIIEKRGYFSYLEIGVYRKENFNEMTSKLKFKISVDPDPEAEADFMMTSEMFFKRYGDRFKFDIIFIDGMHLCEYVKKDI